MREYNNQDNCDVKHSIEDIKQDGYKMQMLSILEETGSQMAIEEITNSEAGDDSGGRDYVAI